MWLKWFVVGTFLLSSFVSFAESGPSVNHIVDNSVDDAPLYKVWETIVELGKKFVEKLKALTSVLNFFQSSPVSSSMKLSKHMGKESPAIKKEEASVEQRTNMLSAVNAFIEKANNGVSHDRFKREPYRGRGKRRRFGDEADEDEYGAERDDEEDMEREGDEEEEELARRRRKRRRGNRRRGKRSLHV